VDPVWRGLQMAQCAENTAYCWMDCLDLPAQCTETQSECVNADSKPCCTEDITENCEAMDDTCQWQCKTTTSTVASNTTSGSSPQPTSVTTSTSTSAQPEERFCESGTDMYMKGFAVLLLRAYCV